MHIVHPSYMYMYLHSGYCLVYVEQIELGSVQVAAGWVSKTSLQSETISNTTSEDDSWTTVADGGRPLIVGARLLPLLLLLLLLLLIPSGGCVVRAAFFAVSFIFLNARKRSVIIALHFEIVNSALNSQSVMLFGPSVIFS